MAFAARLHWSIEIWPDGSFIGVEDAGGPKNFIDRGHWRRMATRVKLHIEKYKKEYDNWKARRNALECRDLTKVRVERDTLNYKSEVDGSPKSYRQQCLTALFLLARSSENLLLTYLAGNVML